jgi:hypothetical protein
LSPFVADSVSFGVPVAYPEGYVVILELPVDASPELPVDASPEFPVLSSAALPVFVFPLLSPLPASCAGGTPLPISTILTTNLLHPFTSHTNSPCILVPSFMTKPTKKKEPLLMNLSSLTKRRL